jgi:hypothetical protein
MEGINGLYFCKSCAPGQGKRWVVMDDEMMTKLKVKLVSQDKAADILTSKIKIKTHAKEEITNLKVKTLS